MAMIGLEEFKKLSYEEQVTTLTKLKMDYKVKGIMDNWGLKHSANYYSLLRKLKLDDLVRERARISKSKEEPVKIIPVGESFSKILFTTESGKSISENLSSLSKFLENDDSQYVLELKLTKV